MRFRLLLKKFLNSGKKLTFFIAFLLLGLKVTFAADSPISTVGGIVALADKVAQWIAYIFWAAAVGAIFYAGFLYLTAGDDSERVKKAKKQLMYSIIAIAIGLMAWGIPKLVDSFLRGQ